jgi:micrococcal nuclease
MIARGHATAPAAPGSVRPRRRLPIRFPTRSVWAIIILCALVAVRLCQHSALPSANFRFEPGVPRHVERVIDGDTIVVDGHVRVRLIGVDTPETVHPHKPVETLGPEATQFTRSLVDDRDVTLGFDRERRDRYGRVLAYVYVDGKLVNEEIIRAGFSRAETRYKFARAMALRFQQAEDEAREAGRGIWSLAPAANP